MGTMGTSSTAIGLLRTSDVMFRVVPRKHQSHWWPIPIIHRSHRPSFNCWQLGTSMEQPWASTNTKVAKPRATSTFLGFSGDGEKQGLHRIPPSLLHVHDYMIMNIIKKNWQNHCIKQSNNYIQIIVSKYIQIMHIIEISNQTSTGTLTEKNEEPSCNVAVQLLGDAVANHHRRALNLSAIATSAPGVAAHPKSPTRQWVSYGIIIQNGVVKSSNMLKKNIEFIFETTFPHN